MNMKKFVLLIVAVCSLSAVQAQDSTAVSAPAAASGFNLGSWMQKNRVFQNLDISVTAGTPGIGIDVASKVGDYVQLRAGYEFMPRFSKSIYFPIEVGGQPARLYDENGNRKVSRFDRLANALTQFTGYDVEDEVEMVGKPTINNFKFLVDVMPFKNKNWHVTAGFYWGPSQFAYAENSTQAMTSLLAVGMYNQLHYKVVNNLPVYDDTTPEILLDKKSQFEEYGRMGFPLGQYTHDVYGYYPRTEYGKYGVVIHEEGEYGLLYSAGDTYRMEPDSDGMVKVYAKSNPFKPYLGFGYGGRLYKNRDDWKVSFDCGAMFWGGTPDLFTHDGTNLTKDVENISGKAGDWVDLLGGIKVYPVLSVRFTKTIF